MTSTRWHRTQCHGSGGPISVGRSFIRRRGSWDRRCSGMEGDIGNDSFHFQTESGFSALGYSFIFVWDPVSSSFQIFLPLSLVSFFFVPRMSDRFQLQRSSSYPFHDISCAPLLFSPPRRAREARFGQPNLLNRWLGKRATDGERG